MKIYIDFDDVICEAAKYFAKLAKELFGTKISYDEMQFFHLQKAFALSDAQYDALMKAGHLPEHLLAYEETPYASDIINKWLNDGHDISIVTGRPFNAYEPSRMWLDCHGLSRVPLVIVDKYGRESIPQNCPHGMTLENLYRMDFDFAIEDSPAAFEHVLRFRNCSVAVFDRPWNRLCALPNDKFMRCRDWLAVDSMFAAIRK